MGDDHAVGVPPGDLDGVQRLRQGADLVGLDEDGVGRAQCNAVQQPPGVGGEQVVAHDHRLVAQRIRDLPEALEVLLAQGILDGHQRKALAQRAEVLDQLTPLEAPPGLRLEVAVPVDPLRSRRIHRQAHVLSGLPAGLLDGAQHPLQRRLVFLQIRREAALVAHGGGQPLLAEQFFQRLIALRAHAHGLPEAVRAHGHEHELLNLQVVVRVPPAVDDVHHRAGQLHRLHAADPAVQRQLRRPRRRVRHRPGGGDQRVAAQLLPVLAAVQLRKACVHLHLAVRVHADESLPQHTVHALDGLAHVLSLICLAAVAQLVGLVATGGRARGCAAHAHAAVLQAGAHLQRGNAPGIQDAARPQIGNLHDKTPPGLFFSVSAVLSVSFGRKL